MRWCCLQTNENDLQAKTYPTIWAHLKLHNNDENEIPFFPECMYNTELRYLANDYNDYKPIKNQPKMISLVLTSTAIHAIHQQFGIPVSHVLVPSEFLMAMPGTVCAAVRGHILVSPHQVEYLISMMAAGGASRTQMKSVFFRLYRMSSFKG